MGPTPDPPPPRGGSVGTIRLLPHVLHHAAHASPLTWLHDIEIAPRIHPNTMAGTMDRTAPPGQPLAIQRQNADHATVMLGDVDDVLVIHIEKRWADQLRRPDGEQLPILIEDLHAVVLTVGDQQASAAIDPHPMGQVELPRGLPRLAPRE